MSPSDTNNNNNNSTVSQDPVIVDVTASSSTPNYNTSAAVSMSSVSVGDSSNKKNKEVSSGNTSEAAATTRPLSIKLVLCLFFMSLLFVFGNGGSKHLGRGGDWSVLVASDVLAHQISGVVVHQIEDGLKNDGVSSLMSLKNFSRMENITSTASTNYTKKLLGQLSVAAELFSQDFSGEIVYRSAQDGSFGQVLNYKDSSRDEELKLVRVCRSHTGKYNQTSSSSSDVPFDCAVRASSRKTLQELPASDSLALALGNDKRFFPSSLTFVDSPWWNRIESSNHNTSHNNSNKDLNLRLELSFVSPASTSSSSSLIRPSGLQMNLVTLVYGSSNNNPLSMIVVGELTGDRLRRILFDALPPAPDARSYLIDSKQRVLVSSHDHTYEIRDRTPGQQNGDADDDNCFIAPDDDSTTTPAKMACLYNTATHPQYAYLRIPVSARMQLQRDQAIAAASSGGAPLVGEEGGTFTDTIQDDTNLGNGGVGRTFIVIHRNIDLNPMRRSVSSSSSSSTTTTTTSTLLQLEVFIPIDYYTLDIMITAMVTLGLSMLLPALAVLFSFFLLQAVSLRMTLIAEQMTDPFSPEQVAKSLRRQEMKKQRHRQMAKLLREKDRLLKGETTSNNNYQDEDEENEEQQQQQQQVQDAPTRIKEIDAELKQLEYEEEHDYYILDLDDEHHKQFQNDNNNDTKYDARVTELADDRREDEDEAKKNNDEDNSVGSLCRRFFNFNPFSLCSGTINRLLPDLEELAEVERGFSDFRDTVVLLRGFIGHKAMKRNRHLSKLNEKLEASAAKLGKSNRLVSMTKKILMGDDDDDENDKEMDVDESRPAKTLGDDSVSPNAESHSLGEQQDGASNNKAVLSGSSNILETFVRNELSNVIRKGQQVANNKKNSNTNSHDAEKNSGDEGATFSSIVPTSISNSDGQQTPGEATSQNSATQNAELLRAATLAASIQAQREEKRKKMLEKFVRPNDSNNNNESDADEISSNATTTVNDSDWDNDTEDDFDAGTAMINSKSTVVEDIFDDHQIGPMSPSSGISPGSNSTSTVVAQQGSNNNNNISNLSVNVKNNKNNNNNFNDTEPKQMSLPSGSTRLDNTSSSFNSSSKPQQSSSQKLATKKKVGSAKKVCFNIQEQPTNNDNNAETECAEADAEQAQTMTAEKQGQSETNLQLTANNNNKLLAVKSRALSRSKSSIKSSVAAGIPSVLTDKMLVTVLNLRGTHSLFDQSFNSAILAAEQGNDASGRMKKLGNTSNTINTSKVIAISPAKRSKLRALASDLVLRRFTAVVEKLSLVIDSCGANLVEYRGDHFFICIKISTRLPSKLGRRFVGRLVELADFVTAVDRRLHAEFAAAVKNAASPKSLSTTGSSGYSDGDVSSSSKRSLEQDLKSLIFSSDASNATSQLGSNKSSTNTDGSYSGKNILPPPAAVAVLDDNNGNGDKVKDDENADDSSTKKKKSKRKDKNGSKDSSDPFDADFSTRTLERLAKEIEGYTAAATSASSFSSSSSKKNNSKSFSSSSMATTAMNGSNMGASPSSAASLVRDTAPSFLSPNYAQRVSASSSKSSSSNSGSLSSASSPSAASASLASSSAASSSSSRLITARAFSSLAVLSGGFSTGDARSLYMISDKGGSLARPTTFFGSCFSEALDAERRTQEHLARTAVRVAELVRKRVKIDKEINLKKKSVLPSSAEHPSVASPATALSPTSDFDGVKPDVGSNRAEISSIDSIRLPVLNLSQEKADIDKELLKLRLLQQLPHAFSFYSHTTERTLDVPVQTIDKFLSRVKSAASMTSSREQGSFKSSDSSSSFGSGATIKKKNASTSTTMRTVSTAVQPASLFGRPLPVQLRRIIPRFLLNADEAVAEQANTYYDEERQLLLEVNKEEFSMLPDEVGSPNEEDTRSVNTNNNKNNKKKKSSSVPSDRPEGETMENERSVATQKPKSSNTNNNTSAHGQRQSLEESFFDDDE